MLPRLMFGKPTVLGCNTAVLSLVVSRPMSLLARHSKPKTSELNVPFATSLTQMPRLSDLLDPFKMMRDFESAYKLPTQPSFELTRVGLPVNMIDTENELQIDIELAGIPKADIHVNLDGNMLTVSGEKKRCVSEEDKNTNVRRWETSYGSFQRTMSIPSDCSQDASKIKAVYEHGVLHLKIPKLPVTERPGKDITIE